MLWACDGESSTHEFLLHTTDAKQTEDLDSVS